MTGAETAGGLPVLGLGTSNNTDPEQCRETVRTALEMGYRHVDTAARYGNEAAVGAGLAAAEVPREDVFLATKVWHDSLGYRDVLDSARASLDRLGVDYVDLLYVHWPATDYDPEETLPAFAELVDDGLARHAAVSNFEPRHLERATEVWGVEPFANQVEMHPLFPQTELREYCGARGIDLVAYSPLARTELFDVPEIAAVADARGVSPAQVSLAWLREKGVAAIPKATGEAHLRDNLASLDLELTDAEIDRLDGIDRRERIIDPTFGPW